DFVQLMVWFLIALGALLPYINSSFGAFLINTAIKFIIRITVSVTQWRNLTFKAIHQVVPINGWDRLPQRIPYKNPLLQPQNSVQALHHAVPWLLRILLFCATKLRRFP
ncbi:hypothetical protein, partial [Providencia sp. PROV193]|uniref:hypothetical protein n=1 Tax=Providencia sp. PROV193 TaxID=2949894 RepID=UPI00234B5F49